MKMKKAKYPTSKKLGNFCIKAVNPHFRIEWMSGRRAPGYTWDGSGSGILRMSERSPLKALHDVAHVMICSESRLELPEFGLGPDPANDTNAKCKVRNPQAEENLACDLHWIMAVYLKGTQGGAEIVRYLHMTPLTRSQVKRLCRKYRERLPPDTLDRVLQSRAVLDLR